MPRTLPGTIPTPALATCLLLAIGTIIPGSAALAGPSISALTAQLNPSTPARVRLQTVLLLGRVGGRDALQAVADAFGRDSYPPVKATSATILGKSRDVRWVRVLHPALKSSEPVVVKACMIAINSLVKGFRKMKNRLKRYRYRVDLRGMLETTEQKDSRLTAHFQEQMLFKLYELDGFEVGTDMDLREDTSDSVREDDWVDVVFVGKLTKADLKRKGSSAKSDVKGDLRILLKPGWYPLSPWKSASATRAFAGIDEYTEDLDLLSEAIAGLVGKLHRKLWPFIR